MLSGNQTDLSGTQHPYELIGTQVLSVSLCFRKAGVRVRKTFDERCCVGEKLRGKATLQFGAINETRVGATDETKERLSSQEGRVVGTLY
ncbi:hypothetical protein [Burkholderia cenocepacia]|uniref:hypothetical protein n=1 Tax=Burkholderia cenocepacia TaxID=95486 RepID=UPI000761F748|nr:hypothetical protein [Burkholderia cenocepacia]KWU19088.1 hypothetical protein AS149_12640 [Burkholderia cenocepacia]